MAALADVLLAATLTLLTDAAREAPDGVLIAIDDVQWLDPPSERALRFALRFALRRKPGRLPSW